MLAGSPLQTTRWWGLPGSSLATALVVVVAFITGLAGSFRERPLETHEVYVAQTAREMMAAREGQGDFVRPMFNGVPRLNKPPLMYWCVIAASKALPLADARNVPPWVARFPSALASALMAWFTVTLGAAVYSRRFGQLGALLGIGTVGWLSYSNNARPEMLYAALSVGMLACWATALRLGGWFNQTAGESLVASNGGWWALAGWACGGGALLAKGPQIPACLIVGVVVYAVVERRFVEMLRALRPLPGVVVLLSVALPWVILVLMREPGTVQAWTADLFAGREVEREKGVLNYVDPFYFYAVPGLILPWAILLPFGIASVFVRARPDLRAGRMLFWPLLTTVLIMGVSVHRRDYYMLALMPAMTLMSARGVLDWLQGRTSAALRDRGPRLLVAASAVSIAVCIGLGSSSFVWRSKLYRDAVFADAAARLIGPRDEVWCFRTDFAKVVYAMNRPVNVVDDGAGGFPDLPAPVSGNRFVLTTIDAWEREQARRVGLAHADPLEGVEVARAETNPGDNRDVLLRITSSRWMMPAP